MRLPRYHTDRLLLYIQMTSWRSRIRELEEGCLATAQLQLLLRLRRDLLPAQLGLRIAPRSEPQMLVALQARHVSTLKIRDWVQWDAVPTVLHVEERSRTVIRQTHPVLLEAGTMNTEAVAYRTTSVLAWDVSTLSLLLISEANISEGVVNPTLIVTVVVTQTFTAFPSQSRVQTSTVISTITPSTSSETNTARPSGSTVTSASTTSAPAVLPLRPTDSSTSISFDSGSCPTGFYACSAFYRGGCCRTGRNCQTTSCPPTSSTTIISGTVTVVVPIEPAATVATPSGVCATGWSTCAASVGGNCCPSGWECGTASCSSISPSQTNVLQKGSPNGGVKSMLLKGRIWTLAGVLMTVFVCL
jgi:hypothetical protein